MLVQRGFKRTLTVLMLAISPFAYSDPLSHLQETVAPFSPKLFFHFIQDPEPVQKIAPKQITKIKPWIKKERAQVREIASWYSETDPFINRHTANGEVFDDQKMTCAAWNYDFGTKLKVTNLLNGKSVVCRVNDRGPNKRLGRAIDLTRAAFRRIADPRHGLIQVSVQKLQSFKN